MAKNVAKQTSCPCHRPGRLYHAAAPNATAPACPHNGDAFPQVQPQVADIPTVEELLTSLRETTSLAAENVDALTRVLTRTVGSSAPADEPAAPWGEELVGLANISAAINAEVNSARIEILTAQPDGPRPPKTLSEALAQIRQKVASGVQMRTLYQHTARFDEATKEYVRSATEIGAEVRTLSEFFERLMIFDQRVAFIPSAADRTRALKITHPALVGFLVDVFSRAWDRAAEYPFVPSHAARAATEVLPDLRSSIKLLLVHGHSDAAIARRLGISSRSLQGHIQRIKQDLGAANRLQLGFRLALAGECTDGGRARGDDPSAPPNAS